MLKLRIGVEGFCSSVFGLHRLVGCLILCHEARGGGTYEQE